VKTPVTPTIDERCDDEPLVGARAHRRIVVHVTPEARLPPVGAGVLDVTPLEFGIDPFVTVTVSVGHFVRVTAVAVDGIDDRPVCIRGYTGQRRRIVHRRADIPARRSIASWQCSDRPARRRVASSLQPLVNRLWFELPLNAATQ
jgi:hypothetical protein